MLLADLHARRRPPADPGGRDGGAPLVLVHGLTDDGGCWPDALARWRGRDVWTVDLPGHGRSPRLAEADLADPMARVAASVGAALTALAEDQGRPAVAVGHSMGAGALVLAALAGAPVDRIVVEDPRIAHPTTRVRERMGRMRAREVALWQQDPARMRAELVRACPRWSDTERAAAAAARPLTDVALLASGRAGLHGDDDFAIELLCEAAARVPTLLVTGDRAGAIWTPGLLARLHERAAGTVAGSPGRGGGLAVAVVPGGDHCPRRVAPEAYHAAVDAHLEG